MGSANNNEFNRYLIKLYFNGDEQLTATALKEWFESEQKNISHRLTAYPANFDISAVENLLARQLKWCESRQISFTPLLLIDGFQLPDVYTEADLQYLL